MSKVKEETDLHPEATSPVSPDPEPAKPPRGWLMAVLFGIAMLVLGLVTGRMLASDGDDTGTWGGEIDDPILTEIDELLDDYWAAWDTGDGDAVVALMANDGWFSSTNTTQSGHTGDQLATYVNSWDRLDFTQVGPTTVIETFAGYEVVGAERVDQYNPEPLWALDHYVIVEEDGQLRIASHQVISAH